MRQGTRAVFHPGAGHAAATLGHGALSSAFAEAGRALGRPIAQVPA